MIDKPMHESLLLLSLSVLAKTIFLATMDVATAPSAAPCKLIFAAAGNPLRLPLMVREAAHTTAAVSAPSPSSPPCTLSFNCCCLCAYPRTNSRSLAAVLTSTSENSCLTGYGPLPLTQPGVEKRQEQVVRHSQRAPSAP